MVSFQHAQDVLQQADRLYSGEEVQAAIERLAGEINTTLAGLPEAVLVLPVMNGGLVLGGQLLPRLNFPMQVDYVHATRYRNTTTGRELEWKVEPQHSLEGRTLLIIDDIFDEGYTLEAVQDYCLKQGAARVLTVVLIEKEHPRARADMTCDFIGLTVGDRYVFGFGMDYKSYHRNLDGIFAVSEAHND